MGLFTHSRAGPALVHRPACLRRGGGGEGGGGAGWVAQNAAHLGSRRSSVRTLQVIYPATLPSLILTAMAIRDFLNVLKAIMFKKQRRTVKKHREDSDFQIKEAFMLIPQVIKYKIKKQNTSSNRFVVRTESNAEDRRKKHFEIVLLRNSLDATMGTSSADSGHKWRSAWSHGRSIHMLTKCEEPMLLVPP